MWFIPGENIAENRLTRKNEEFLKYFNSEIFKNKPTYS